MSYHMSFAKLVQYDPGQPSITVAVTLSLSQDHINCEAKVDTGASLCIFARDLGEQLGLEVESGMRQLVGTVTGTFVVYLHEVNLSVAGLECSAFVGFAEDTGFRRNVLGRRGFLEQITLGLVDYEAHLPPSTFPLVFMYQ
jgi:hypothetical protein